MAPKRKSRKMTEWLFTRVVCWRGSRPTKIEDLKPRAQKHQTTKQTQKLAISSRCRWGARLALHLQILSFGDQAHLILEARALAHMEGRRVEPDTSYKPHFASKIGQFKGACSKTPNDKDVCHSAVLGARSLSFGDFADALKLAKSGGGVGFA